jgi:hypothetical protein
MSSSAQSPPKHVIGPAGPTSREERMARNRAHYLAIQAMIDNGENVPEPPRTRDSVEPRNESLVWRLVQQLLRSPRSDALRGLAAVNVAMVSLVSALAGHRSGGKGTQGESTGDRH